MSWFAEIYFAIDNLLMQILKFIWYLAKVVIGMSMLLVFTVFVLVFGVLIGRPVSTYKSVYGTLHKGFADTFKK